MASKPCQPQIRVQSINLQGHWLGRVAGIDQVLYAARPVGHVRLQKSSPVFDISQSRPGTAFDAAHFLRPCLIHLVPGACTCCPVPFLPPSHTHLQKTSRFLPTISFLFVYNGAQNTTSCVCFFLLFFNRCYFFLFRYFSVPFASFFHVLS